MDIDDVDSYERGGDGGSSFLDRPLESRGVGDVGSACGRGWTPGNDESAKEKWKQEERPHGHR